MRVVILGASRFGAAIAKKLIEESHEVVLIDKDRDRFSLMGSRETWRRWRRGPPPAVKGQGWLFPRTVSG